MYLRDGLTAHALHSQRGGHHPQDGSGRDPSPGLGTGPGGTSAQDGLRLHDSRDGAAGRVEYLGVDGDDVAADA